MKKTLTFIVALLVLLGLAAPAAARAGNNLPLWRTLPGPANKISPSLQDQLNLLQADQTITVIVQLRQRANLPDGKGLQRGERLSKVIDALKLTANGTQGPVKTFLKSRNGQGRVKSFTPFWIFNGFSITADAVTIEELATLPDVLSVSLDAIDIVPVSANVPALSNPEQNISLISAPSLWNLGYTGQGVVIASMDTGVYLNHPDLVSRWRGGTNSWFDPYAEHPNTPADMSGHGTWTMGVMLGGDAGGTSVGVAPGAQWIAARVFNDQGGSTATAVHQAYQWLLDPDNNPATSDAPQVINNSWAFAAPGCNLEFEPDLQSLRAAGILPVFAAGNSGPNTGTSHSPANNPSAFAVGAINNNSLIYGLSSRGPSDCGGSTGVFPELVAPGVNINTTDLGGFYTTASGTSLSAPHVAGGLALLLSAYPNLTASQQETALLSSAVDLGAIGPDDNYGYGRLDLLAAHQWLAASPTETPSVPPTFTPTLISTETPTNLPASTPTQLSTDTPTTLPTFTPTVPVSTFTPTPTGSNSTGWQNPSKQTVITSGGDGNGFEVSPTNAFTDDGLFAMDMDSGTTTSTSCGNSGKDRHKYSNYNISIPADAVIQGIEIRLDAKADSTVGTPTMCAAVTWNSGSSWSSWKNTSTLTTAEATYVLGGSADTWGHTWTTTELSNTGFQVRILNAASDISRDFSLDWITVNVTYSSGAGPTSTPTVTNTPQLAASTPTITNTPQPPTVTLTATNTPVSSTSTSIPTATNTVLAPTASFTPTVTNTSLPPTATFTASVTNTPTSSVPSNTPTALPTATSTLPPTNSPSSLLYFSTLGNTNPPGVSGTADDSDVYYFNGSAFSRMIDASGSGSLLGLPSGANVDGFDRVDAAQFYLSFKGSVTVPGLGTVEDEDVVFYNTGIWSLFFDGSANGLSGTDLDAINIAGGALYFSTDDTDLPPGAGGAGDDADIYVWNGGNSYTRVVDANGSGSLGLPSGADVDGYVRVDANRFYLSFNADVSIPVLGAVQDEDVVYYDNGVWSMYFDGTALGLTSGNLDVDAFDLP
ncbi:MAG: S8 family serine peptidase [Chloroflexi bacterium]|nr:S8 family serine peptidase [Chloroflexota bacterium]